MQQGFEHPEYCSVFSSSAQRVQSSVRDIEIELDATGLKVYRNGLCNELISTIPPIFDFVRSSIGTP
jgi:hypothetical protein